MRSREQRDLDLGGTGVGLGLAEAGDDLLLLFSGHGGHATGEGSGRQPAISAASAVSRSICSISASTQSKRFSPRMRCRNASRSSWP